MNSLEDEYSLISEVVDELTVAGSGTGDRVIAKVVINLGRKCRNVQEFKYYMRTVCLFSFSDSFVTSIFNSILHELIKIELIVEEPEFLRQQRNRSAASRDEVLFPLKNQDSPLYRAAANYRGLIEKHRWEHGEEPEGAPIDHSVPWGSIITINQERYGFLITGVYHQILDSVKKSHTIVVYGESGSGKTTKIPQCLAFARHNRRVGCTQPSELAAIAAAIHAAEDIGCMVGEFIGCKVGSEDRTGPETAIKYMTESVLWDEITADPKLSEYAVIMIDEAQERSVTMEVILGLIKKAMRQGAGFQLVLSTVTEDEAVLFANYFSGSKILEIPSRCKLLPSFEVKFSDLPCCDPLKEAIRIVLRIHEKEPLGDILVFLSGQDEAELVWWFLSRKAELLPLDRPKLIVYPAWKFLRGEIDPRVFQAMPANTRKVVVSTAVAEASMAAIDGIRYVIDTGLVERRAFDPGQATDALAMAPISAASALRRATLAGRTWRKGKCFRLYTAAQFYEMSPALEPEIQTVNLSSLVLRMLASGITDIWNFDFVDRPPPQHVTVALGELYCLEALDENGALTAMGKAMALFPLDPPWSRALVAGLISRCSKQVLTIIAMVRAGLIFFRPWATRFVGDQRHRGFSRSEGDHLIMLDVYDTWRRNGCSSKWCLENFVNHQALIRAKTLRNQLATIISNNRRRKHEEDSRPNVTKIRKAITSGMFFHAARWNPVENCYRTLVGNHRVYIHPRSALNDQKPSWVIYNELVRLDDKEYMYGVMVINSSWLVELAPRFFKAETIPRSKKTWRTIGSIEYSC